MKVKPDGTIDDLETTGYLAAVENISRATIDAVFKVIVHAPDREPGWIEGPEVYAALEGALTAVARIICMMNMDAILGMANVEAMMRDFVRKEVVCLRKVVPLPPPKIIEGLKNRDDIKARGLDS